IVRTGNFSGEMSGIGSLVIPFLSTFTLSGNEIYAGETKVNGTLQAGSATAFSPFSAFDIGQTGILSLGNGKTDFTNTVGYLSGHGSVNLGNHANTYLVLKGGDYSGELFGTGGVLVLRDAVFSMRGGSLYSGPTFVEGTLQAESP